MVDKVEKVKRPRVNWFQLMHDCYYPGFSYWYIRLKAKHPKMSDNRIAYNVLKRYYSTTSLDRVRWLGVNLANEPMKLDDAYLWYSSDDIKIGGL